jgi:hypothetical protein
LLIKSIDICLFTNWPVWFSTVQHSSLSICFYKLTFYQ